MRCVDASRLRLLAVRSLLIVFHSGALAGDGVPDGARVMRIVSRKGNLVCLSKVITTNNEAVPEE